MLERISELLPDVISWRHHLHENPELEFDVLKTAAFVAERLREFGCDEVIEGLGRTGVVGTIKGRSTAGNRTVGLRADMDALPIAETTNLPYRSRVPGLMHACGHDGHSSMLLGAARYLAEIRDFSGTVILVFQPAEEGGAGGARAMIDDGLMKRFGIDEIYGMHNWPGIPVGSFAIRNGSIMAAFDSFSIEIEGKGGHAATPDRAVDTVLVLAAIVNALQSIVARNVDPRDAVVISACQIHAGEADNVIPQFGRLSGSVRTLTSAASKFCEERMHAIAEATARSYGARASVTYKHTIPAMVNEAGCTGHFAKAAAHVVGQEHVDTNIAPQMGSEDFAEFLLERPGAFILIGNGDSESLHHPAYNFNDDALPFGMSLWTAIVRNRLPG
jgi:amidohydrolase